VKKLALAVLAVAFLGLCPAPLRAQDQDDAPKPAPKKIESRNDILKRTFKELASKDSGFVVKVGASAYGVIVGKGVIVTTADAAKAGGRVAVRGAAGSGDARVLGVDERNAVALLECPFEARGIEVATGDPKIGQYVLSIGTDDEVVAAGVLSAKDRKVEPRDLSEGNMLMGLMSDGIDGPKRAFPRVLQHDAPLTEEILGSALVDSSGNLVGMNVGTGYRGSSYAIGWRELSACIESLKSGKAPAPSTEEERPAKTPGKPWLGASVKEAEDGALVVTDMASGGPAEKAGIQKGDRIFQVDGVKVMTLDDLADRISGKKPGDEIAISLMRAGDKQTIKVRLGEK
jgi:putative serine protease PepD